MRLLQLKEDGKYELTTDLVGNEPIPAYAILSHTWGLDIEEVSYDDITKGLGQQKLGYDKLRFCAEQAKIDDVATRDKEPQDSSWLAAFKRSRWHTRGWTLQELIAPRSVEFFSSTRTKLGDKRSLEKELHEITGVPGSILQGGPLSDYTIEKRLSWMDCRQTKREEDQAYALMGLFEVHMPLIYGEGKKNALRRLNEEITKSARFKQHVDDEVSLLQPQEIYFRRLPKTLRARSGLHSSTKNSTQSSNWEVLDEDNLPETIKGARSVLDRWVSGTYQMCYPATEPVANIILSVDWHAFNGDPFDPLLEWRIHTPQSLHYPGTHTGQVKCSERREDIFKQRSIRVWFDSPIYSPLVTQGGSHSRSGATSSEGELEDMAPVTYRLDHILQSVAHFLAYGPWYDGPEAKMAPFRFHRMGGRGDHNDRDALTRASSFWARAYTMPIPDENDFSDTGLPDECRETTITVISELMERYNIPIDETWDFETSLKTITSQRGWALEERKWADRLRPEVFK